MKFFRNNRGNPERRTRNSRRNLSICSADLKSETSQNSAGSRKLPNCPKRSQMTSQNSSGSRKLLPCSKMPLRLLTARLRAARMSFPRPHSAFIAFRGLSPPWMPRSAWGTRLAGGRRTLAPYVRACAQTTLLFRHARRQAWLPFSRGLAQPEGYISFKKLHLFSIYLEKD